MMDRKIAVLIPCYNEELTIEQVVKGFKKYLPTAEIYVFDNNSTDNTAQIARNAGAIVVTEKRQGKGNVIRSMFRYVDADIYVLVDGDSTYMPQDVVKLLEPIYRNDADMVIGDRLSSGAYDSQNNRKFHGVGNRLVIWLVNRLFNCSFNDILSGYRTFNRYFVKNFPVLSEGFEIETEMTLHALDKRFRVIEIPVGYKQRPLGSVSKLNTFSDGLRVIKTIFCIFKIYKPLHFFCFWAFLCSLIGIIFGMIPIIEYIQFSYVSRVPLAILAASLEILAMMLFCCGIILDINVRHHKEIYELHLNYYTITKNREKH
jgi:glycosyltransferase involved in cell wall biosynthesis